MDNDKGFFSYIYHKHPVFFNFIFAIFAGLVITWFLADPFLNLLTRHGSNAVVPDVKGMKLPDAVQVLADGGFEVHLDSVFDSKTVPGIITEQSPVGNAKVKDGRAVYLTYSCYSPKLSRVPMYYNMSRRQAQSAFEEAGFTNITIKEIPSEHANLVYSAKYNGLILQPNKEIPVDARIIIEVGVGSDGVESYYEEEIVADDSLNNEVDSVDMFIRSLEQQFNSGSASSSSSHEK